MGRVRAGVHRNPPAEAELDPRAAEAGVLLDRRRGGGAEDSGRQEVGNGGGGSCGGGGIG